MANPAVKIVDYAPQLTYMQDLEVLKTMWFGSISGNEHQEVLESFYASQAHLYDGYRHRMLHGRKPMVSNMPVKKGDVWVDMGGGTGSNVEYFRECMDVFEKVVVVDLTPSLVKVAKQRVEENGWTGKVEVVEGDATDPLLPGLPDSGTVDIVTFSYSLSMIPEWESALANAFRLLKPGGHLCVCDFTVDPARQWSIMQYFWKTLFASDHVHLNEEHRKVLEKKFVKERVDIGYGSFPYVPLLRCPYYYFIGRKPVR
eukprot:CAMPEP_0117657672 /NCGR_PEP_ID=MMETSP0804-20121206/5455_1 /TAXON_ID=1074897 /ORGANISM="Tetraselmis astigmatica, Strain CCMP880" /LENGTH=256 /DNA_ID=CAMNT_0005464141 /DNA_START=144 /DNA_END=914 /DNA_ORIENTATION=+